MVGFQSIIIQIVIHYSVFISRVTGLLNDLIHKY